MRTHPRAALLCLLLCACPGEPGTADAGADAGEALTDAGPDGGGGTDGGSGADAGSADAGSADAGTLVNCDSAGVAACLTNEDCAFGEACRSASDVLEKRCCLAGARGTDAVGTACTTGDTCAFGRCIERDDGAAFCSGACDFDTDCPGFMFCSDLFGWCVPYDTAVPPTECRQVDLPICFFNENCQADERCEDVGGLENELLCCTIGARGTKTVGEPCTSGLDCTFGRCLGGLCSEECDFGADPCPPETMECDTLRGMCTPL